MANYRITGERLTGIADQVRRLAGVEDELTPATMQMLLEGVSPVSDLPVAEGATFGGGDAAETYKIQGASLEDIADAIQEKKETTAIFTPAQMATEIRGIVTGDDLPDAEDAFFGSADSVYEYGIQGDVSGTFGDLSGQYGYEFTVNADIAVYGFRLRSRWGSGYTDTVVLWDSSTKSEIARLQMQPTTYNQWVEGFLQSPINLKAGRTYAITGYCSRKGQVYYNKTGVTWNSKITLKTVCYSEDYTYPTKTNTSWCNAVDIIIGPPLTESVTTEYKVQAETMNGLADAIREKGGIETALTPKEMIQVVNSVNMSLQEKSVTPTTTAQTVTPDSGYYGLSKVIVAAAEAAEELPIAEQAIFGAVESKTEYAFDSNSIGDLASIAGATIGWKFTAVESFMITEIHYKSINRRDNVFCIWNEQRELVRSLNYTVGSSQWNYIPLSEPLVVNAGETYTVALYNTSGLADAIWTKAISFNSKLSNVKVCKGAVGEYPSDETYPWHTPLNIVMEPVVAELPESYEIARETLDEIADEVNRIAGTSGKLSLAQILAMMKAVG